MTSSNRPTILAARDGMAYRSSGGACTRSALSGEPRSDGNPSAALTNRSRLEGACPVAEIQLTPPISAVKPAEQTSTRQRAAGQSANGAAGAA